MAPDLPPAFLARMQRLLGEAYPAFLACYDQPGRAGLRVNTLKLSPGRFASLSPFPLEPLPWCPSGFLVPPEARPGRHPYHAAGLYYLQEPSAMTAAAALDPQPGERVLDLAASPGGKSTHLAALMEDSGLLVANEIRTKRVPALASNLERWGARRALVVNETPNRLADRLPGFFDRVLVDAPCSGEGMFRRDQAARLEWDAVHIPAYAARQSLILEIAARLVRPGGLLVYSTCTFAPEENEGVVAALLERQPDFALEPLPESLAGRAPARPDWAGTEHPGPWDGAARIWPHLHPGEGHFLARLRRRDGEAPAERPGPRLPRPPRPALEDWHRFAAETLPGLELDDLDIVLLGGRLYALPPGTPDLAGLRVSVPGWQLGEARKGRFEPAHALALAVHREDCARILDLAAGSPELAAYLRGETLPSAGEAGWTLAAVDGFPLGWGRRVQGVLKNRYPAGLRQR
jgi:NOL1/NOP2/sun family putative RNA methylase